MIRFFTVLLHGDLGTGEILHMSHQEKSRVWIHPSRLSVSVPYSTPQTHTHTHRHRDTQ